MTKLTTVVALLVSITACKKTETVEVGGAAAEAKAVEAPPAAPVDKKLAGVGVTVSVPADANITESKTDLGAMQATIFFTGMPMFFVSTVNDGSDSLDSTISHAGAKDWKIQDKAPDASTWKLEWTKPDLLDAAKLTYNVAVRAKVGAATYDCSSNGLTEAQATSLLKICASLK